MKNQTAKAAAATIVSFLMLATVTLFVKLETVSGASIPWIIFIQFATCLVIATIIASRKNFTELRTTKLKYHIIRGVSGMLAFTFYSIAVTKIPLVNAVLLNNTTPLFIPIITLLWLKINIDEKIWWGISIGFIGIIFILDPTEKGFLKTGDLIGLASGISLAIGYVALRVLSKSDSFIAVVFYYSLIAVILSLPFALIYWSNPPPEIWGCAILSGILFVGYLSLLQYAYTLAEAVKLSPLNFSVIVFTGIFDWLIFDHVPGVMAITGIILVSTGGVLAIKLHEKDNKDLKHHWH